ncbi:putative defensin-like protein 170 isoform X2 [Brassica rapa]|uniref:putative defensin-like protein 170 isoform X2 n=1 Tax=Brassica campestris TaxID=3711 RepID=UPI00142D4442|nr:putative defensin-like protein 170 isoform X2 [Brassica rapa]
MCNVMAKAASLFVFPIMFFVMLSLVEYNMGCMAVIGSCRYIPDCGASCRVRFGIKALGYCDRDGAYGTCICTYPCLSDKINI